MEFNHKTSNAGIRLIVVQVAKNKEYDFVWGLSPRRQASEDPIFQRLVGKAAGNFTYFLLTRINVTHDRNKMTQLKPRHNIYNNHHDDSYYSKT